jgi:hypothetical protein
MRRALWAFGALLIVTAVIGVIFSARPRFLLLVFVGIGLSVIALYGAFWFRGSRWSNLCITALVTGLCLSVLDPLVIATMPKPIISDEGSWSRKYHFVGDSDLGFALPPGVVGEAREVTAGRVIYDVMYTIDANGHRRTDTSSDPGTDNVLFMGDSFTFGVGLNDNETLPELFSEDTNRHYNVVNFGVAAYGLHQVVRALELGRPDPFLAQGKSYIVYTAIPDHARRAVSAYTWAVQGPAYRLGPDGVALYHGNLHSAAAGMVISTLSRSAFLAKYLLPGLLENPDMDAYSLYAGLAKRARQVAEEKYHATFIMLFWDFNVQAEPEVKAAFDAAGVAYIPVSRIIPDLLAQPQTYHIAPPIDMHPTAAANRLIAAYLAKRLLDGTIGQ